MVNRYVGTSGKESGFVDKVETLLLMLKLTVGNIDILYTKWPFHDIKIELQKRFENLCDCNEEICAPYLSLFQAEYSPF